MNINKILISKKGTIPRHSSFDLDGVDRQTKRGVVSRPGSHVRLDTNSVGLRVSPYTIDSRESHTEMTQNVNIRDRITGRG